MKAKLLILMILVMFISSCGAHKTPQSEEKDSITRQLSFINNKNIDFTESKNGFIQIKLNKSTNVKIEPRMTKIEEISYIISIIGIIILIINIIISNKKERERTCQNQ